MGVLPVVATLRRLLKPAAAARPGERCELCDAVLPVEHGHLVDTRTRRLLCACLICGTPGGSASARATAESGHSPKDVWARDGGRYRAVPTRYVHLPPLAVSLTEWEALGIPVDLAFFFFNSGLGRIIACYPGPAGAAESLLPLDAWPALVERNPPIRALAPDVEALLVRRGDGEYVAFIVPIDACYELVGRIRRAWTGFGGGDAGRRAVDEFLAAVLRRTADTPAPGTFRSHQQREGRT